MARSSSRGSRTFIARILRQIALTGPDPQIASDHETNRQTVVKTVLVHVFFLSNFGLLRGAVSGVSLGKTEAQLLFSTGGNQAAHCAPCQISSGVSIQKLITSNDDLSGEIEDLFASTDDLPLRFNIADSSAEGNGLRAAFVAACNEVVQKSRIPFGTVDHIAPHFANAFRLYKTRGLAAIDAAIGFQQQELRAGRDLKITTRAQVISILETYRSTLATSLDAHDTVQGLLLHDVWMDYANSR